MQTSKPFSMRLPLDLHRWIEGSYFKRGCVSRTDYVLQLITKGIQAETIDETIARIKDATDSGTGRELLRQTLAVRYMIEAQARGKMTMPERIGTDALIWADKELARLFPERSTS